MKIFKNTDFPKRDESSDGKKFDDSVEVIIFDETGILHIGYYNYDSNEWVYCDGEYTPYDITSAELMNFNWMYAPEELTNKV
jgi:hypothetical protein